MSGEVFNCEIQARFRDLNAGLHVDSAEAIRIIDEARIQFLSFAPLHGDDAGPGLLSRTPDGVIGLMGSQRVDYHAEMRFAPYAPFRLRLWVCHVGSSSFTVATELRTAEEHPPALIAESTLVFFDTGVQASWAMSDQVRADLERFSGPRVGLR